jgi:hypothetical protein
MIIGLCLSRIAKGSASSFLGTSCKNIDQEIISKQKLVIDDAQFLLKLQKVALHLTAPNSRLGVVSQATSSWLQKPATQRPAAVAVLRLA